MQYNPIVRNFSRLRRILESLGLSRDAIRPATRLADLVPREQRRRVWDCVEREKCNVPPLLWSFWAKAIVLAAVLLWTLVACMAWVTIGAGVVPFGWMAVAIVIGIFAVCILCDRHVPASEIDPSLTVGDLVLAMTSGRECREAGYRLTRNEIFFKVRLIFAASLGFPVDEIKPETRFNDLFDEGRGKSFSARPVVARSPDRATDSTAGLLK